MKTVSFFLCPALLVMLWLSIDASRCDAQTFTIDGPKSYSFSSNISISILLKNHTASTQKIYTRIENNTDNQLTFTPSVITLFDSSHTSGGELVLHYIAHGASVIHAQVIFFDSAATRDTVYITGQDTLFHDALHPYRLYGATNTELFGTTADSNRYIYFKHSTGIWTFPITVRNYSTSPLDMTASFIGTADSFSVAPSSVTLEAYPSPKQVSNIDVSYRASGNQYDTARLEIGSISTTARKDTLVFIGIDTSYRPYPVRRGDTLDFGWVHPGKEMFSLLYLQNPYPKQNIVIRKLVKFPNNTPGFGVTIWNSYPFQVAPGKKDSFAVTFKAPQQQGVLSVSHIGFEYQNPDFTLDTFHYIFIGRTPACYPLEPVGTLELEAALVDGYTDGSFSITNTESTPITITSASVNFGTGYFEEYFSVPSPSLPITIAAKASQQLTVRFAPAHHLAADASTVLSISFDPSGVQQGCEDIVYSVKSRSISPDDTSEILLYPDQTASLPMASTADTLTKRFTFRNNLNIAVKVTDIHIAHGGHFTITHTNPSSLPITLQPNESFTVDVLFDVGINGYYTDNLIVVTEHSLTSQVFHIKALRTDGLPAAVKNSVTAEPFLHIQPNPSTGGAITISAPVGTTKITIFNALGTLVSEKEHTSEWTWTTNTNGIGVSSGIYFIRAEGINDNRKPFIISKKLILDK